MGTLSRDSNILLFSLKIKHQRTYFVDCSIFSIKYSQIILLTQ